MIGLRTEYERMFEVEHDLWWFKILHHKTLNAIQKHFGNDKTLQILDTGCGTGGMLYFLRENGYQNVRGFDLSEDAVEYAQSRGLDVKCWDLEELSFFESANVFDVIICNDTLCFFSDDEIVKIFREAHQKLSTNGVFISNNAALPLLKGTHDIILKVPRRFMKREFTAIAKQANFKSHSVYWSAFLTPLILTIRILQRVALSLKLRRIEDLESDIDLPPVWINNALYNIVASESSLLGSKAPFGSSVFSVFEK